MPSAIEKALGMISPTVSAIDGYVGIGTSIPTTDLVGVALHELTHALGRDPYSGPFDLTRYTSPGDHLFSTGSTAPAAYFSIDGGVTKLADFGQTSDPSDFLNSGVQGPNDPFNEFYSGSTVQSLSTVDKQLLDAMGFDTTTPIGGTGYTGGTISSSGGTTSRGTSGGGHKPKKVTAAGDGTGDDSGHHNFVFAPNSGFSPVTHSPTPAEEARNALLAEIGSLGSTENHGHLSDLLHSFLAATAAEFLGITSTSSRKS